jgi:hypothetical protein
MLWVFRLLGNFAVAVFRVMTLEGFWELLLNSRIRQCVGGEAVSG